jgi:hypothetical protein
MRPSGNGHVFQVESSQQVLDIYTAAVAPLAIQYAVHEEKPLVFIRWFKRTE